MEAWNFLFSFRGRIARRDFWLLVVVCAAFLFGLAAAARIPDETSKVILYVVCSAAALLTLLSAATRRLHDRDRHGWYLYVFFGVPSALATFLSGKGELKLVVFNGGIGSVLDLLSLAIGIWMIVELGCLPSIAGSNQFGADPLSATEPELQTRAKTRVNEPLRD